MLDGLFSPFGPWVTSKLTFWPSFERLEAVHLNCQKWANRSSLPVVGRDENIALASLNHVKADQFAIPPSR